MLIFENHSAVVVGPRQTQCLGYPRFFLQGLGHFRDPVSQRFQVNHRHRVVRIVQFFVGEM